MIIGQAAGVAAAIAIENKVDLYGVPIRELQKRLIAGHAVLQNGDLFTPLRSGRDDKVAFCIR